MTKRAAVTAVLLLALAGCTAEPRNAVAAADIGNAATAAQADINAYAAASGNRSAAK